MSEVLNRPKSYDGVAAIKMLMRPKSIAVIGVSSKPGTAGRTVLANLKLNNYDGDIYVVGRSAEDIDGHKVLQSVDDLPEGVELAIFALPGGAVKAALEAAVRRKVKTVTIFASGFAEVGNREAQEELVKIADEGGVAMLGPNCLGYTDMVDGFIVGFAGARVVPKLPQPPERIDPALAMVSQSGGLMFYVANELAARDLPMAYTVSTGNEAGISLADFVDFFTQDESTSVILLYIEEVRDPEGFLASVRRARAAGKPVIVIHPGRGEKAKAAVSSHTGALAGDFATMQVHLAHAGVLLADTMEEYVDVIELAARFPNAPTKGAAVVTFSGGFCAIAHDFCESVNLEVPPLTQATVDELTPQLPDFLPPSNPLDLGTQVIWQPDLARIGTAALLKDPNIGSVIIATNQGAAASQTQYGGYFLDAMKADKSKPAIYAAPAMELAPEFAKVVKEERLVFSRSSERTMRAVAALTNYGLAQERAGRAVKSEPFKNLPKLGKGTQPEWLGKQLLSAIGVKIPDGGLATTIDEAKAIAAKAGYPVAIKAQAGSLAHKTEAGGVLLGIKSDAELSEAWDKLHANIAKAAPGLKLDGVLVEKMAAKGLELVIGANRDPKWGPIILAGLGGIWVEAIGDVRLMPADLAHDDIVAELHKLRSAKLLGGFRGQPPVDVDAVAKTVALIGRLMTHHPEIKEIDLNPVFAHAKGEGLTAVDALIVTAD